RHKHHLCCRPQPRISANQIPPRGAKIEFRTTHTTPIAKWPLKFLFCSSQATKPPALAAASTRRFVMNGPGRPTLYRKWYEPAEGDRAVPSRGVGGVCASPGAGA